MRRFTFQKPPLVMAGVVLATGLAGARIANAQEKPYCAADANHDGRVTLQEFESWATDRLMAADGPRAQRFKELTPQQQAAVLQHRFDKLDVNNQGYLDCSG